MANQLAAPMAILHCQAPTEVLKARIQQRQALAHDASEADQQVLAIQLQSQEPLTASEQTRTIVVDTTEPADISRLLQHWRSIS
jgi:predicted kinase